MRKLTAINRKTALKFLGYVDEIIDPEFMTKIDDCEEQIINDIHPRYMCMCYNLEKELDKVKLAECDFILPGQKIANELFYCKKAVLFCATLSSDIDLLISLEGNKDIERGVILDCLAAAALEEYCDMVEEDIKEKFPNSQFTARFSPLYGDLPDGVDRDFTAILDSERRIGVYCSENGVFTPRHSITAVIGIM